MLPLRSVPLLYGLYLCPEQSQEAPNTKLCDHTFINIPYCGAPGLARLAGSGLVSSYLPWLGQTGEVPNPPVGTELTGLAQKRPAVLLATSWRQHVR